MASSKRTGAALGPYHRKRDFSRTPEPEGGRSTGSAGNLYIIQKHAARALHYDFRLELDGVLKSWAVPKGPSLDPADKRLAMETEDHPIEYGGFEGIIPQGQYGGGTVMLWDRGSWTPEGDARAGYAKGAFKFQLHGEKLKGGWALVRIRGREKRADARTWLLVKEKDDFARPGKGAKLLEERAESVATGRDMKTIAGEQDAVWQSDRESTEAPSSRFARQAAARVKAVERVAAREGRGGRGPAKRGAAKAARTATPAVAASRAKAAGGPAAAVRDAASPGEALARASAASARTAKSGRGAGASSSSPSPRSASKPSAIEGARRGSPPRIGAPEQPTLVSAPPAGGEWLHEMKFDGYRVLARVSGARVRLISRNGSDWTKSLPGVARALAALGADVVLDGEVAVVLPDGTTSFQELQNALGRGGEHIVYFVFDLLYWDGYDLTRAPLEARKEALAGLLGRAGARAAPILRYSQHVVGQGEAFFRTACGMSLEGVVSKRRDAPYESGRSRAWLKVKCVKEQEVVVGGYTEPSGSRVGIGALLVGVYENGALRYAGKVGTGYTRKVLEDLRARLTRLERRQSPFEGRVPGAGRAHWVEPRLVAQVRFSEWTRDGRLRHPSFEGLRLDKKAPDVVREVPRPTREVVVQDQGTRTGPRPSPMPSPIRRASTRRPPARSVPLVARAASSPSASSRGRARPSAAARGGDSEVLVGGVRITHPGRVIDAASGLTKGDVARYYDAVSERILPHLRGRPLTLVRCPEGVGGGCFYSKHAGRVRVSPALRRVTIREKTKSDEYLIADSKEALLGLAQMGVLEIHTWNARDETLETPDRIVLDLDPGPEVAWPRVIDAAFELRDALASRGLTSFVKTTGGKGLHIVAPLVPKAGWDACYAFARDLVLETAGRSPRAYVATMSKAERTGRIFIDYLRNSRGATSVAAFSTRARPGIPVSAPIAWEDLNARLLPDAFTTRNLAKRLAARRRDPWAPYDRTRQNLPAEGRRTAR